MGRVMKHDIIEGNSRRLAVNTEAAYTSEIPATRQNLFLSYASFLGSVDCYTHFLISARSASPDHGPNREVIELEDDVFLSPNKNDRKIDSALLITNKEEALECYRRMIEVNIDYIFVNFMFEPLTRT